jgi:aminopeptidase YwaD
MDMVGGGPATKAIFHVTRGPMSLPSFVYDVGEAFGDFVNRESDLYASTGAALYPFVSAEGGKEALQAEFADYSMGSDHDVYQEGSFRIPAIYLNDWPDRYIHTNGDTSANIDPTKLKRAAFIGAASGYFLAKMSEKDVPEVLHIVERRSLVRWGTILSRHATLDIGTWLVQTVVMQRYERAVVDSLDAVTPLDAALKNEDSQFAQSRSGLLFASYPGQIMAISVLGSFNVNDLDSWKVVFARNQNPKGPMTVFGYDYLADHLESMKIARPRLLDYQGLSGSGEEYAYETLNFVDGKRNIADICSAVSTEYGPISQEFVLEYLKSLESVGVLKRAPVQPTK